ncbi:MAG: DUF1786 domain-containing protein [Limnochordia bacterium]|jgi:uncharacterized protein (DUF1786 family)
MSRKKRILAIDIGAGTQDILLYEEDASVENSVQMVLPSPTVQVARRIQRATDEGCDLCFTGVTMGGGPCAKALREHLDKGLKAMATPPAAATFDDDLDVVRSMGVDIVSAPPLGMKTIHLSDVDLDAFHQVFELFDLDPPTSLAIAVQDHGRPPKGESDRVFRFQLWKKFVMSGGQLEDLVLREVPDYLTRMKAIQQTVPHVFLMDTASSAIWGALCDPWVNQSMKTKGCLILNVGNGHTLGALVRKGRVWGLFEHHTRLLDGDKLGYYLSKLQRGAITHGEVFTDGGHGAYVHPDLPRESGLFEAIAVTGPNRAKAADRGYHMANPYGDMMLAGCFGLLAATGFLPV